MLLGTSCLPDALPISGHSSSLQVLPAPHTYAPLLPIAAPTPLAYSHLALPSQGGSLHSPLGTICAHRAWRCCLETHFSLSYSTQHLLAGELLPGLVSRLDSCPLYRRHRGFLSSLTGPASFLGYGSRPIWLLVSCQHLAWLLAPLSSAFSGLARCQKALLLAHVPPLYCPSLPMDHPLCGTECVLHPQDREEQGLGFTGTPGLLHDITPLGRLTVIKASHSRTGGCSRVGWG